MTNRRIVLTLNKPEHVDLLWDASARRTAQRHGFCVETLADLSVRPTKETWRQFLKGAEAIITVWDTPTLDEEVLGPDPAVRFVGHAGGSLAGIVSPYLFDHGVQVCTANKVMAESVARWCLMMSMVGMRGLLDYAQWGAYAPLQWENRRPGMKPDETVFGIWGFGDITRVLLDYLKIINPAEILVCSRSLDEHTAKALGVTRVNLRDLFLKSDVLHLLQALNEHTKATIDASLLRLLRDNTVLINAGRAHLLNEEDFLESLRENRYLAITDVHFIEPLPPSSPFSRLPNLIATPHWAAMEGGYPYVKAMLDEYGRFLAGEELVHKVPLQRALGMTLEMTRSP